MVSPVDAESDETLFARYRNDRADSAARDELITRHLPLARKLARRYGNGPEHVDDLEQVAALGLVKAVDRFDPARGVTFSSFAVPTVLGELRRHFRDTTWTVRPTRGIQELTGRIAGARDDLTARLSRSPTTAELAGYLGCSSEKVVEAHHALLDARTVSLDADPEPADQVSLHERVGSVDSRYDYIDEALSLAPALDRLTERERDLIVLRFSYGLTQSEIAARVGISQMHVSRLLQAALDRLRRMVDRDGPLRARSAA